MTIAAGLELPEAQIAEICRQYPVKELSLFGSAARGEMRPDSDIDFPVDFLPGARPGFAGGRGDDARTGRCTWAPCRHSRQACLETSSAAWRARRRAAGLCGVMSSA